MAREVDENGDQFPNGKPPNHRVVTSCRTCKYVDLGYEGEANCKRFPVRYEWHESDEEAQPSHTERYMICDAHEEDEHGS